MITGPFSANHRAARLPRYKRRKKKRRDATSFSHYSNSKIKIGIESAGDGVYIYIYYLIYIHSFVSYDCISAGPSTSKTETSRSSGLMRSSENALRCGTPLTCTPTSRMRSFGQGKGQARTGGKIVDLVTRSSV